MRNILAAAVLGLSLGALVLNSQARLDEHNRHYCVDTYGKDEHCGLGSTQAERFNTLANTFVEAIN